MKKIQLLAAFLFCSLLAIGQNNEDVHHHHHNHDHLHPCGTPHGHHPWWQEYNKNRAMYNQEAQLKRGQSTTYLPVSLHVVANDDGMGHGSVIEVLTSFCRLNDDYDPADFHFFIEFPIDIISNSSFNSHDTILDGGSYAFQYNVPNTFNPYFVSNPAGYCGYSVRYADAVTVNYGCLGGHTFSHELGHDMLLEHPFYGWEGGISHDGTTPADFNSPAPTEIYVDYSMHNVYNGPSIVDTVLVENVDRTGANTNCAIAGDGFCDTPADYIAYRWQCDANSESSEVQTDPNGNTFKSVGNWIMSYSNSACQADFSQEQIAAMQAFVFNQRSSYLYNQNPTRDSIAGTASLLTPADGTAVPEDNITFSWNSVPGATHYVVEVSNASGSYSAAQLLETVITTDTFFVSSQNYQPRAPFLPYAWRVKPFNQGYTCAPISSEGTFTTTASTAVNYLAQLESFVVYPNPSPVGQMINLDINFEQQEAAEIKIHNMTGQLLHQQAITLQSGQQTIQVETQDWTEGMYLIELSTKEGFVVEKIILQ